ncbi:MAG TPA: helix-turn-helix domain-containing protein [Acidimicrobiales bacterium]
MTAADVYREWQPPPEWRHAVACCWEQVVAADRVQHVVPDGHADLLIHASGRIEVVGLQDRVALPALPQGTHIRGIRLRPEAVAPAFGVTASSLRNLTVTAEDVLGARGAARLLDPRARDRWLRDVAPDGRTAAAVRLLADTTVADAADQLGITDRHLRRVLLTEVGLTPKAFQRVLRLQRFLAAVEGRREIAAAAAASGYADQAHLTREARALTGETPRALLRRRGLAP